MSLSLDDGFLSTIRSEPLPPGVKPYKLRMIWIERDGTPTPIPLLRTSHLEAILLKSYRSWKLEAGAGAWRLSRLPFILREYEYRLWLDTNPVIT